jgi:hypothetical protein
VNSSQIKLTWTDTSSDETAFEIRRGTSPGGPYSFLAQVGAGTTTYTNTGLVGGATYYYQVLAQNSSGYSAASNEAAGTTADHEFYEAEWLPIAAVSSGDTVTIFSETALSGGQGNLLNDNAIGDYVTYTVAVPEARTYNVSVGVKKFTNRGKFQLSSAPTLGGTYTNIGVEQDLYSATAQYPLLNLGNATFGTAGNQSFRFKVTSKNASSSGYLLAFDYIVLTPQ